MPAPSELHNPRPCAPRPEVRDLEPLRCLLTPLAQQQLIPHTMDDNFVDLLRAKVGRGPEDGPAAPKLDPRSLWDEEEWALFKGLAASDAPGAPASSLLGPRGSGRAGGPLRTRGARPIGAAFLQSRPTAQPPEESDTDLEEAAEANSPPKQHLLLPLHERYCRKLGIVPIQRYLRSLDESCFRLRYRGLLPTHAKALSAPMALSSSYNQLDLEGNYMGPVALRHFCSFLRDNAKITHINLTMNNIGSQAARDLCAVLLTCSNLQHLELSGNHFGDADGRWFMDFLAKCSTLRVLDLSNNEFSTRGAAAIGTALAKKSQLQSLDLSFNHIRLKGAESIAAAMRDNGKLRQLYLAGNGFGVTGTLHMIRALIDNRCLEHLDLSDNRIPFSIMTCFAKCFKANHTLRELRLCSNPVSPEGALRFVKLLEEFESCALEILDIRDVLVSERFMEIVERIKQKRPRFSALVGYVSSGKDTNRDKKKKFTDDNPLVVLLMFMSQRNMRLVDLFKSLDKDQSMSLTQKEFIDGLKQIDTPLSESQLNDLINMLDKDGDGEVDLKEIMNINEEFKDLKMKANKKARDKRMGAAKAAMFGKLDDASLAILQEINRLRPDSDEE